MKGFIKLHRKMLDWEWYSDANVKSVFLHLLLTANFTSTRWRGIEIEAGQRIIGVEKLGSQLGLTRQQTRTALNKLKSTGEITIESTSKYTLVTVCNWEEYQSEGEKATNKTPSEQPTDNHQVTINQPTNNHSVRKKELKNLRTKVKGITRARAVSPPVSMPEVSPAGFDEFWKIYPRKQGKVKAETAYRKLDPDEKLRECIVNAIMQQRCSAQWTEDGGRFIPHPATWLNQKLWSDELPKARSPSGLQYGGEQTMNVGDLDYLIDDLA